MYSPQIIRFASILLVLLFTAHLFGCGGKKGMEQVSGIALDSPGSGLPENMPAREVALEEAVMEIEAAPAPLGVDAAVWEELRFELARLLSARFAGGDARATSKVVSTPPAGAANAVSDLALADDSAGGYRLEWSYVNVGDYDQNGEVNIADLTPIGQHFGATSADAGWETAQLADGDANNEVNIADVTPIGQNFLTQVVGYRVYGGYMLDGPWELMGAVDFSAGTRENSLAFSYGFAADDYPTYRVVPVDSLDEEGVEGLLGGGAPSPLAQLFAATPEAAMTSVNTDVVFTVGLHFSVGDPQIAEVVEVDESGEPLAVLGGLADDGEPASGDETALDHVYSLKAQVNAAEAAFRFYRARITYDAGGTERTSLSNIAAVLFFADMTEARAQEILDHAAAMQLELETLAGSMPIEDAAQQVLDDLLADGGIPAAGLAESGEGVWWFTPEGIPCAATILDPEEIIGKEGSAIGSPGSELPPPEVKQTSGQQNTANTVGNLKALFLNAFYFNGMEANDVSRRYGDFLLHNCPKYDVDHFDDFNCDLPQFKSLNNYGVVMIGSYGDALLRQDVEKGFWQPPHYTYPFQDAQVAVCTTEGTKVENIGDNLADLLQGRMLLHGKGWYWILPDFVRKYCKDMSNSLVYMSTKKSMHNDSMAKAFAEAGAAVYFGHTGYVYRPGHGVTGGTLFAKLFEGQTTGQAYDYVQANPISSNTNEFKMQGSRKLLLADSEYIIIDLGTLGPSGTDPTGAELSWANDVNHWGHVVGRTTYPEGNFTGFLWRNGQMEKIGNLGGGQGEAMALNDFDQVVGNAQLGEDQNFLTHAFFWENGQISDLGSLADTSFAYDINNAGVIVGETDVDVEGHPLIEDHPCTFSISGGINDLGTFGSTQFTRREDGVALAINQLGQIIGRTTDYGDSGNGNGFISLGPGGGLVLLPYEVIHFGEPQPDYYSSMRGINNRGQIVGGNYVMEVVGGPTGGTGIHAKGSFYNSNFLTALGLPGTEEWLESNGTSINDAGVIVGYAENHGGGSVTQKAYIIPNDRPLTQENPQWLDELLACDSGWTLGRATAINERGYIAGDGRHNGKRRAFLMIPRD
ncbi:hypothetical protein IIA79_03730 [bacterium]|nr:hypothetical protein [bacterium]